MNQKDLRCLLLQFTISLHCHIEELLFEQNSSLEVVLNMIRVAQHMFSSCIFGKQRNKSSIYISTWISSTNWWWKSFSEGQPSQYCLHIFMLKSQNYSTCLSYQDPKTLNLFRGQSSLERREKYGSLANGHITLKLDVKLHNQMFRLYLKFCYLPHNVSSKTYMQPL